MLVKTKRASRAERRTPRRTRARAAAVALRDSSVHSKGASIFETEAALTEARRLVVQISYGEEISIHHHRSQFSTGRGVLVRPHCEHKSGPPRKHVLSELRYA